MKKIAILLALLTITLFSVSSCGGGVSQEEYDMVEGQLSSLQSQLAATQSELAAAKAQHEELDNQYGELQADYDSLGSENDALNQQYADLQGSYEVLSSENDALNQQYADLQDNYNSLSDQYSAVTGDASGIIIEEALEQALFALINADRDSHGLDELDWGVNLYNIAKNNNKHMINSKKYEEPTMGSYQEVIWATGYPNTQIMAESIFAIWQNHMRYETEFFNEVTRFGTVAVTESDGIYYVTYVAATFE